MSMPTYQYLCRNTAHKYRHPVQVSFEGPREMEMCKNLPPMPIKIQLKFHALLYFVQCLLGPQQNFSEILEQGAPFPGSGRTCGRMKGEAVENGGQLHHCYQHHASFQFELCPCWMQLCKPNARKGCAELLQRERRTSKNNYRSVKQHLEYRKRKLVSLIDLFKSRVHFDVPGTILF